ncbi:MAG: hypothetical protein LAP85_15610 [Acidobacteriia bacterium]|nr:hypothetical protein [Terriglobia bacterium]
MAPPSIKSQSVIPRLDGIARDRLMLQKLGELPDVEFAQEENFVRAQFYLRRALEGVFKNDLGDFDTFAAAIKAVLEHPESFGLSLE